MDFCQKTLPYLLEKLPFIKLYPKKILVIGKPDLEFQLCTKLQAMYPAAVIDFFAKGLREYPLTELSYDLIVLHWIDLGLLLPDDLNDNILSTYELLFYLLHHLLAPKGLLLFSSLGPETMGLNVAQMSIPMNILGDLLLKLGYQDPVLDRDCFEEVSFRIELAYGHAWRKATELDCFSQVDEEGTVFMPITQIRHLTVHE